MDGAIFGWIGVHDDTGGPMQWCRVVLPQWIALLVGDEGKSSATVGLLKVLDAVCRPMLPELLSLLLV
jgi:hypothetical protein